MERRHFLAGLAGFSAVTLVAGSASAQQWPSKNISIIVPFAAGGSTDVAARLLADKLRAELGQSVIVDNKPGGGSNIGAAAAARSTPDGHTLLLATSTMAANVSLYKNMGFDLKKDLVPITQLTLIPNVLVVHNDVPARTLAEFIDYAKKNKGTLNYGSSGAGASQHLAAAMFSKMADIEMVHVPYKGGSQANNDLIAGHIQLVFAPLVEVLPFIESGKLRALGVTTKTRAAKLQDVPAIHETLPGFEVPLWNGLFAPAGTPQPVVDRVASAAAKVMADPAIQKQVHDQGSAVVTSTPAAFKAFVDTEISTLAEIVKISGAQLD